MSDIEVLKPNNRIHPPVLPLEVLCAAAAGGGESQLTVKGESSVEVEVGQSGDRLPPPLGSAPRGHASGESVKHSSNVHIWWITLYSHTYFPHVPFKKSMTVVRGNIV